VPTEEINPAKTLESYYRQSKEKRKSMTNKPLNNFIIWNFGLEDSTNHKKTNAPQKEKVTQSSQPTSNNELKNKTQKFNHLSIDNSILQEGIHKILNFTSKQQRSTARRQCSKPHYPCWFTPNLKSTLKWQVCQKLPHKWNSPTKYFTDQSTPTTPPIILTYEMSSSTLTDVLYANSPTRNGIILKES